MALNISCFILLSFDQVQSVGTAPSSEIKVTELLNVLLLLRSLIRRREVRRMPKLKRTVFDEQQTYRDCG